MLKLSLAGGVGPSSFVQVKWLRFLLLGGVLGTHLAAAASKPVDKAAPASGLSPSKLNPAEAEFQRVMALDDAAHKEIDKWIKENGAFARQGAGLSEAGLSLRIEQRLAPVKRAYEEFFQQHPNHARGHLAYGSFLNDVGEETQARKHWEKALELDPTNPAAFNNLANSYGQTGPVARAFELYSKAIEMNPRQAIYYHNLGSVILLHRKEAAAHYRTSEQKVVPRALEFYRLAQQLDPQNFQLATDIGQAYYALQPPDHNAAILAWTRALALARDEPGREGTHLHLARVKAAAGRLNEARAHLHSVTNATLAAVKDRLARELFQQPLQPRATDDVRPRNLLTPPK